MVGTENDSIRKGFLADQEQTWALLSVQLEQEMEKRGEGCSQKNYGVQHLNRVVEASSLDTDPRGHKTMGDVKGVEESCWKVQQGQGKHGQVGSSASWRCQDCGKLLCTSSIFSGPAGHYHLHNVYEAVPFLRPFTTSQLGQASSSSVYNFMLI